VDEADQQLEAENRYLNRQLELTYDRWVCPGCGYAQKVQKNIRATLAPNERLYCINCGQIKNDEIDNTPEQDTFQELFTECKEKRMR
jgi:ribosomal protein S27AE